MNKKIKFLLILVIFGSLMYSCASYTPITATDNPVGPKIGYTSHTFFLGLWLGNADLSIKETAKKGGITKIATVEFKRSSILGIFTTYTTIVTGE